MISVAEQSKIDDELIQEYLSTHKLDSSLYANDFITHINWEIVPANEGDSTLTDIAVKDTITSGGVVYYSYYIKVEEGKNKDESEAKDLMVVDYREFLLDNSELSSSKDDPEALELEIKSRINGIRLGLKHFNTGIVPTDNVNYDPRSDIEGPGRGILIFPSGLAHGDLDLEDKQIKPNQPLRVDLVLYEKKDFPVEE